MAESIVKDVIYTVARGALVSPASVQMLIDLARESAKVTDGSGSTRWLISVLSSALARNWRRRDDASKADLLAAFWITRTLPSLLRSNRSTCRSIQRYIRLLPAPLSCFHRSVRAL